MFLLSVCNVALTLDAIQFEAYFLLTNYLLVKIKQEHKNFSI